MFLEERILPTIALVRRGLQRLGPFRDERGAVGSSVADPRCARLITPQGAPASPAAHCNVYKAARTESNTPAISSLDSHYTLWFLLVAVNVLARRLRDRVNGHGRGLERRENTSLLMFVRLSVRLLPLPVSLGACASVLSGLREPQFQAYCSEAEAPTAPVPMIGAIPSPPPPFSSLCLAPATRTGRLHLWRESGRHDQT